MTRADVVLVMLLALVLYLGWLLSLMPSPEIVTP